MTTPPDREEIKPGRDLSLERRGILGLCESSTRSAGEVIGNCWYVCLVLRNDITTCINENSASAALCKSVEAMIIINMGAYSGCRERNMTASLFTLCVETPLLVIKVQSLRLTFHANGQSVRQT